MSTKSISLLAAVLAALAVPATASVKFHSNSVKYRDTSKKPASGRSGSASVMARALVNPDGSADLELTTGSFDPPHATGNIDKVQIKSQSTGTINDNHLVNDGTYTTHLDAAGRGERIELRAHVSGINGRNSDVVALTEMAKLRPDLAVTGINVPPSVVAGSPSMLSASIQELNGDMGARADCVLRVNGATADSATGIWVDAGGSVSCSFLHTFATPGSARVEVALRNVRPGDYDEGNNALETTVTVTSEQGMQRWAAGSYETELRYDTINEASWGYHSEYHQAGWTNSTYFVAVWGENLDFSTLHASYVEKTDDTTLVEKRDIPLERDDSYFWGNPRGQCMVSITDELSAVICQRPYIPAEDRYDIERPAFINPMFERRAGDVTYLSREWGYPSPDGGTYVRNEDAGGFTYGNQTRLGSRMSLEVEISDATHQYAERPSYALRTQETQEDSPWQCWNDYWCGEWHFWKRDVSGGQTSPGY